MYLPLFIIYLRCCEDCLTCDIAFNAVMPLSRASTRRRYSRIEGVTLSNFRIMTVLPCGNPLTYKRRVVATLERMGTLVHFYACSFSPRGRPRGRTDSRTAVALPLRAAAPRRAVPAAVTPSMRLYLPRVEARLRGITALKAMSQVRQSSQHPM